jgi:hypothetical protein
MVCEHQRSVLFRSFSSCDDARDLVLVAHSADIIRIVVFGAVLVVHGFECFECCGNNSTISLRGLESGTDMSVG